MLRKSVFKKILAVFLISTLTFANTAFVTKSYATTIFDSVFNNLNAEHKNVVFDAYFQTEKDKSYSVISAVNKTPILGINLKVQEKGYFKNAKIKIQPKNEKAKLNFEVIANIDETEYVKGFENNELTLKLIQNNSQISLELPFTYVQEEYIELEKISQEFYINLTGIYVNEKGKEIEINKNQLLNLTWLDEREIKLSSEITKYIPYQQQDKNGIIFQTLVKVDSTVEKSLAVESTKLEIKVPQIQGAEIEKVNVIAKSTQGIDGKNAEQVKFSDENWSFENGILKIQKENPYVEKIYSTSGIDEYLITYNYKNVSQINQTLKSDIKAQITTFGKEPLINEIEQEFEYKVSEPIGEIVSYEVQNETSSISKGYTYLNYNKLENPYEMEFISKQIINISNKELVEEIYIEDINTSYFDDTGKEYEHKEMYYKSISIPKDIFENILSKDGYIELQNKDRYNDRKNYFKNKSR